jgi:hypothetical protein
MEAASTTARGAVCSKAFTTAPRTSGALPVTTLNSPFRTPYALS